MGHVAHGQNSRPIQQRLARLYYSNIGQFTTRQHPKSHPHGSFGLRLTGYVGIRVKGFNVLLKSSIATRKERHIVKRDELAGRLNIRRIAT